VRPDGTTITIAGGVISSTGSGSAGVSSLNSLPGAVNLVGGSGISVTPSGSSITIGNTGSGAMLTTTAAATDTVTVAGMTSTGYCSLTATNASAATNIATTYISAKTTNQITVTHATIASMTYDVMCTAF